MKITAIEEYGLRCMVLLANSTREEPLSLSEFQLQEGLSVPYAAKLLMILKTSGLVKAVRGRNGGYALALPAEKIMLRDIFHALGEPAFSPAHCKKHTGILDICIHSDDCRVRDVWKSFDSFIGQVMDRISLADVARGNWKILETVHVTAGNSQSI